MSVPTSDAAVLWHINSFLCDIQRCQVVEAPRPRRHSQLHKPKHHLQVKNYW